MFMALLVCFRCGFHKIVSSVKSALNKCEEAIDILKQHELSLYNTGIISYEQRDFTFLDLECTLLHLAGEQKLTDGVLYWSCIPDGPDNVIRYVYLPEMVF